MGLDGDGLWRASARSAAVFVTVSAGEIVVNFFYTGKSSVVLETRSNAILVMYNVRHQ